LAENARFNSEDGNAQLDNDRQR